MSTDRNAKSAARYAGKVILDGVYNDVKNPEGFRAECRQGMEMGFDGKTLIHPSQVEPCNEAYAPSEDEIDSSRRVIEAFDQAVAEGKGVVTVDGEPHEMAPGVAVARRKSRPLRSVSQPSRRRARLVPTLP